MPENNCGFKASFAAPSIKLSIKFKDLHFPVDIATDKSVIARMTELIH
jgi:hypothetical protein